MGHDQQLQGSPAGPGGWNWGAFTLTWIWGVAHRTYVALWVFVPILGWIIMPIVLGAKGNDWAWRNREWKDVDEFRRAQRAWTLYGVFAWTGALLVGGTGAGIALYSLQHSQAFELASAELRRETAVVKLLGEPIEMGRVTGSVSAQGGGSGEAKLEFPISGPKARGTAYVIAHELAGQWLVQRMDVQLDSGPRLVLERTNEEDTPPASAADPAPPPLAAAPVRVVIVRGLAEVHGSLPRQRAEQVIDASLAGLEPCFSGQPLAKPMQLKIKAIIGPKGNVQTAALDEAPMSDPPFARCIAQEVRRWSFPAPKSGIVVLRYALTVQGS